MKRPRRGRRRGWMENHPLAGTCGLCDQPLGDQALIQRRGEWIHKTCWTSEKGE